MELLILRLGSMLGCVEFLYVVIMHVDMLYICVLMVEIVINHV